MISYKMARRSFLRNCGGSAGLLIPLLRGIEARAQGVKPPLRFLVIHHPLGGIMEDPQGGDFWRPAGATATTTTFTLPANSAPFAPLQSKMVMIDGLNIVTASQMSGSNGGQLTHEGGVVALMTGVPTLGKVGTQDHCAAGPSIDQLLLARSPLLGGAASTAKTPFGSLQLAADIRSDRDEIAPRVMSYLPPTANTDINLARQPLYSETQPLNTFMRIFGGVLPTGSTAATLLAQKLSVLDFMRSDLARLGTLVPATEKPKLATHADAINQLQASLMAQLGPTTGMPGGVCVKPATPLLFNQTGIGAHGNTMNELPGGGSKLSGVDYYDPADPNNHPHIALGRLQLSLIKTAFVCDLVRVATFMWSAGTNWVVFPGNMNGSTIPNNAPNPHHPPSHTTNAATIAWLRQIDLLYSQQTSLALQEFVNQTDVDGTSNLLDNTIVAYVTEVARAYDHHQENVPFLVFGGKNTGIQGGKFLKVTDGNQPARGLDGFFTGPATNRSTNDVWLALAPKFGVTLTALGNKGSQYIGPLPGLIV